MRLSSHWWFFGAVVMALALPQRLMADKVPAPADGQKTEATAVAPAPVIRASRFELVDSKGLVRAVLGTDADGTVGVHVYDQASGKERLCMGLSSGDPIVMLLGSGGEVRLALGVAEQSDTGVLFIPGFGERVTVQQFLSDKPLTNTSGSLLMGEELALVNNESGSIQMGVSDLPRLDLDLQACGDHSWLSLSGKGLGVGNGNQDPVHPHPRAFVGMDGHGKSILELSSPSGLANTTLINPEEPSSEWTVLESAYGDATSTVASKVKDFELSCSLFVWQREGSVLLRLSPDVREQAGIRTDGLDGYGVIFIPFADQGGNPGLYLVKRVGGVETVLASTTQGFPRRDGLASLTIRAQGNTLTVLENGSEVLSAVDGQFPEGKLVWRVYGDEAHPGRAGFRTENRGWSSTEETR